MSYNALQLNNGIPYLVNLTTGSGAYETATTLLVDLLTGSAFTLPGGQTYALGQNELQVWVDGVRMNRTIDYSETSTTTITFTKDLKADQIVTVRR